MPGTYDIPFLRIVKNPVIDILRQVGFVAADGARPGDPHILGIDHIGGLSRPRNLNLPEPDALFRQSEDDPIFNRVSFNP
ncbi:hypothetical protein D3C73_1564350 [compost metagenome]